MNPLITTPITNPLEALEYLDFITTQYIYHPDDCATQIVSRETGERTYSDETAEQINTRNKEIFEYLDNPYEYCIMLNSKDR